LENITSADSLRMKLRSHGQLPIVSSLLNKIGVFEAKDSGDITLGTGNGDSSVKPVIAPFYVVSEGSALIFVDNKYIKVSENSDPVQVSEEEVSLFPEFMQTCEAFRSLGFKQSSTGIVSENRNLKVAFGLNESGTLSLKINDSIVENIKSVNFGNMFLMESIQTRTLLSKLFENLDLIVNLEFAKSIVNERLGKNAIVLNFGENILEELFQQRYGDIQFERKSHIPHSGDAWLYLPDNQIIILESKNYTYTVNKDEIIKLQNDMINHHIKWGLLLSFNSFVI
jgi:hypothetical protein